MGTSNLGFGARFLLDAHQRWSQASLAVYLRVQNADDAPQDYADLGFQVTVSGGLQAGAGFTDIKIDPPPSEFNMNIVQIGLANKSLTMAAKRFRISHTFVLSQMAAQGYTDPRQVWEDSSRVIGIVYDNRLYSLLKIDFEAFGSQIVTWDITCDAVEQIISQHV